MRSLIRYSMMLAVVLVALIWISGCATTYRVPYPPADELFVTMGDDPGSESEKPYIPKGTFVHVSPEWYLPLPILGLIVFGNANPQHVFEDEVLPKIREMGGDALTNARVEHTPRPHFVKRLLGLHLLQPPALTIVTGQVVKR